MTSYAEFKRLPAQERDELGFAKWKELQVQLKRAALIDATVQRALSEHKPDCRDQDALYADAVEIVRKHQKASISLVQRHLKIGYFRAAGLLEAMERSGLVSFQNKDGMRTLMPALMKDTP